MWSGSVRELLEVFLIRLSAEGGVGYGVSRVGLGTADFGEHPVSDRLSSMVLGGMINVATNTTCDP